MTDVQFIELQYFNFIHLFRDYCTVHKKRDKLYICNRRGKQYQSSTTQQYETLESVKFGVLYLKSSHKPHSPSIKDP